MTLQFQPESCVVLCIDIQERLNPAMAAERRDSLPTRARNVLEAARLFDVPVIATEQYPRGLGQTLPELREHLSDGDLHEKTSFSCLGVEGVRERLAELGDRTVLVMGMETHVCVWQTVRDLCAAGHRVALIEDCLASRREEDRKAGIKLCKLAGAVPLNSEALLFDWVGDARAEHFKAVSRMVK